MLIVTVATGNVANNFAIDHIKGIVYMSVFSDSDVYSMPTGGGVPAAIGSYPLSNLISLAADQGSGHIYAGNTAENFHRPEGVIDTPAVNWYVKT